MGASEHLGVTREIEPDSYRNIHCILCGPSFAHNVRTENLYTITSFVNLDHAHIGTYGAVKVHGPIRIPNTDRRVCTRHKSASVTLSDELAQLGRFYRQTGQI